MKKTVRTSIEGAMGVAPVRTLAPASSSMCLPIVKP